MDVTFLHFFQQFSAYREQNYINETCSHLRIERVLQSECAVHVAAHDSTGFNYDEETKTCTLCSPSKITGVKRLVPLRFVWRDWVTFRSDRMYHCVPMLRDMNDYEAKLYMGTH